MTLLEDRNLRRTMGAVAARAKQKFDVSAMVKAFEELSDDASALTRAWEHFHFGRRRGPEERNSELEIR